jgi:hypothetical protein
VSGCSGLQNLSLGEYNGLVVNRASHGAFVTDSSRLQKDHGPFCPDHPTSEASRSSHAVRPISALSRALAS